ncbi:MAG: AI-2E family transporter [Chloroflexi bacterium]|nr:AI-2E family transporter [Chloroflexota bacterium]
MVDTRTPDRSPAGVPDAPPASVERAARAWRRVDYRVRSTTPGDVVQLAMMFGALAAVTWLVVATWPALSPFVAGAVVAYALLPLVNRLDRVLPRPIAVLLTFSLFVAAVVGLLMLLAPALASQVTHVLQHLPTVEQVRWVWGRLGEFNTTLPESAQDLVAETMTQISTNFRANLVLYLRGMLMFVVGNIIGLFGTLGFVLGFLVVPGWLLAVLNDQRAAVRTINQMLPVWMRPDFWAVVRIIDRAASAFLQVQLVVAVAVGALAYIGIKLLDRVQLSVGADHLLLALIIGILNLVPQVGPFLAVILAGAVGLTQSTDAAVMLVVLVLVVQMLVGRFITPRLSRRATTIHPSVLVLAIVALSQLGLWWVLLAAPIATIATDLYRYVYARFNEPPAPAGVLAGDSARSSAGRRRLVLTGAPILVGGRVATRAQRRRRGTAAPSVVPEG